MKSILENLETLSTLLDAVTQIDSLEEEAEYLHLLVAELRQKTNRLLNVKKLTSGCLSGCGPSGYTELNFVSSADYGSSQGLGTRQECRRTQSTLASHLSLHKETRVTESDSDREVWLHQGLEAMAMGHYDEAQAIFLCSLEAYPSDPELFTQLAMVYWESGEMEKAAATYLKMMEVTCPTHCSMLGWYTNPDQPFLRAIEGRALALYQLRDYEAAIELFEELFELNGSHFIGCKYLAGEGYHHMGRPQEALACYLCSPIEPCVLYNKGLAFYQTGDIRAASETLIDAIALNPSIAALLIGKQPTSAGAAPGYLGSLDYAQGFLTECSTLWASSDAKSFIANLYLHPLVQALLEQFDTDGNFQGADGTRYTYDDFFNPKSPAPAVRQEIQRLLERIHEV